jgi:hypothetical protein
MRGLVHTTQNVVQIAVPTMVANDRKGWLDAWIIHRSRTVNDHECLTRETRISPVVAWEAMPTLRDETSGQGGRDDCVRLMPEFAHTIHGLVFGISFCCMLVGSAFARTACKVVHLIDVVCVRVTEVEQFPVIVMLHFVQVVLVVQSIRRMADAGIQFVGTIFLISAVEQVEMAASTARAKETIPVT